MTAARAWLGAAVVASIAAAVVVWLAAGRATPVAVAAAVLSVLLALVLVAVAVAQTPRAGLGFEYQVPPRFRAVCREKGLARRAGARMLYPPAGRLSGNAGGFRLTVRPLIGQALADWERA